VLFRIPGFALPGNAEIDSTKIRKIGVLPLPTFGYAPETRAYVGAVALFTLRFYPDSDTRTSNAKTEISFTQNKQKVISAGWNWFSFRDRYYFSGEASFNKFPEDFFGIGNNTPETNRENYDSRRVETRISFLKQLKPGWFTGPRYLFQYMYKIVPVPDGLLATGFISGKNGGTSSGLGYTFSYDKRNNLLNPKKAGYASFSQVFFVPAFGSDFTFTRYEIDFRRYLKGFQNHTLALQAVGCFNSGEPPFRMLALLGSDADMRGYYRGRYRDRNYTAFQAEYRATLIGRFGITAFGGCGEVSPSLSGFTFPGLKPTYGVGLRFLADRKENVNMRFDFAWGKGSSGFYVAFGEAF
jgi:outer membrane protein assembly factor BamA